MSYSAPVVQRRRDGLVRSTRDSELPYLDHGAVRNGSCDRVGGTNLRQVAVLSKTDWEGIQYRLNKRQIEAERVHQQQEEKQRLHELSLERVKNWSNTVYGQRQKKLEDRRIRLEKEEEERKKIDIEEAKIQAEQRKAALEKAKLQQYYQTDRVKAFHSALLLTEVLKEREKQIELKKLKEEAALGKDRSYVEKLQRDMEEAMRREEEDKARVREERFRAAEFQKAQARERRRQADQEKQDELIEGEHIKKLTTEFIEEERQKQLQRQEMAKQQAFDNRRQIEDVALMKQIDRMQEEEEDEECRLFANAKKKMMRLRAEKEKQLRDEKQAKLEVIRDKLRTQMEQKVSDEDGRILAAVTEKEAQKAAEEKEKEEKRAAMLHTIKEHRHDQAKRNEEQALREKREAAEAMKALQEAAMVYNANESEKLRARREDALDLASTHLEQAEERRLREKLRREQDLEHNRRNLELDDVQEAQFQAYARDVIDHCDKRGRNTHALRKVAGQVVPGRAAQRTNYVVADETGEPLPNFQTCGTDATKLTINGNNDSTKRLGFVW